MISERKKEISHLFREIT